MASPKTICQNRKARHNFFIEKSLEAGIALWGSEVKSLREGNANLNDAFVDIKRGEAWLVGAHINPYGMATHVQHTPVRERRLLLHKREIEKLDREVNAKGHTVVPLSLYFKGARVKVEIALAKGKREYDKREDIKKRIADREAGRMVKRLR